MGGTALLAGPWTTGLSPTRHVYSAIVWLLVIWTTFQVGVGFIMQAYCIARRLAGRMTSRYDIEISVVALYWHFTALTAGMTVGIVAGFPLVV
jgi:cytochrome c oxidase subunit I+III